MLSVGILKKKAQPSFFNYAIFFIILAVTALCKGLIGIIIPLIAIFPDVVRNQSWKKHLRMSFILAMIPAGVIYVLPFWASAHWQAQSYGQSGLYLVYRENILRYFQPFDHQDPIYAYFLFLPLYLLPWAVFFFPAVFSLKARWKVMTSSSQWVAWALLLLFVFLTLSGSRRNYYILPLVPFAILLTADWILSAANERSLRNQLAGWFAIIFLAILFVNFNLIQPLFYSGGGAQDFAAALKMQTDKTRPWADWQIVMLDADRKLSFYLRLPPLVKNHMIPAKQRLHQTEQSLLQKWPMLQRQNSQTIFISRKIYMPMLKKLLPNYVVIEARGTLGERLLKMNKNNVPVAFIPREATS